MSPSVAVPAVGEDALTTRRPAVPLVTGALALAVVSWIAVQTAGATGLAFSANGLTNIGQVLAPIVLLSLFIERATEVVITSWRNSELQRRQHLVDVADARSEGPARRALDYYRLETQRLAFLVSFSLALVTSLVGLRVVQPLIDPAALASMAKEPAYRLQLLWLSRLDILLTGLLIAGGADGIHKIVTTFTAFLDATRNRAAAPEGDRRGSETPQPASPVQQNPTTTPPSAGAAEGGERG